MFAYYNMQWLAIIDKNRSMKVADKLLKWNSVTQLCVYGCICVVIHVWKQLLNKTVQIVS